jgi:hypothetical protein
MLMNACSCHHLIARYIYVITSLSLSVPARMSGVQDWIQKYDAASKIVDEINLFFGKTSIVVNRQLFFAWSNNGLGSSERDKTV